MKVIFLISSLFLSGCFLDPFDNIVDKLPADPHWVYGQEVSYFPDHFYSKACSGKAKVTTRNIFFSVTYTLEVPVLDQSKGCPEYVTVDFKPDSN